MAGLEGTTVGPYQITATLGAGGMGQVYRARDPRLDREVAIKVLIPALSQEPGYLERFRREARAVAKLNHPNIVPVYDFGEQGNLTYLVMPLIPGGTLHSYLKQRGILPLTEALAIMDQVAAALQYAHERGLIHRDVKPANVLMSAEGRALLSDFGIVRLTQQESSIATLTHMGAFVGSPEYAAPEMVMGQPVDARVDVYALGVILFQMLTGRLPFVASTAVSLLIMQAQQPPPAPRSLNPAILPAVEAVILKALAKEPAGRYQSAAEFLAALRAASADQAATRMQPQPTLSTQGYQPTPGAQGYTAGPGAFGSLPTLTRSNTPLNAAGSGPSVASPGGPTSGPPPSWAWSASGPAAAPPPAPTFATGFSGQPSQPPALPPSPPPSRRTLLVVLLVLALALVAGGGGALALKGAGFFKSNNTTAQQSPGTTAASPTPTVPPPTPTPAPTFYYMAHFFVVMNQDLLNGDTVGNSIGIDNNHYASREGPKGDLYQMGDALTFGRAAGNAQVVHASDGSATFVVLVDRLDTYQHAQQYFQRDQTLFQGQTTPMNVGEQSVAGMVPAANGKQTYQLFVRDRNIMITIATFPMDNPQGFSDYFVSIVKAMQQRGHRCTYSTDPNNITLLPGNDANTCK